MEMKTKNILLAVILFASVFQIEVMAQEVTWSKWYDYKNYENECFDAIQTYDGGYIFLVNNFIGSYSTVLMKTNYLGDLEWRSLFDKTKVGSEITSYKIHQSKDSGYIFCGDFGGDSAFIIKTFANGDLSWIKTYTVPNRQSRFFGLEVTKDNGIIACGDIYPPQQGCIVKTDFYGNQEWMKLTSKSALNVIQSRDSNYYLTFSDRLLKYSSKGELIWISSAIIGTSNPVSSNLIEYSENEIFVGGGIDSMVVSKIDSAGSLVWSKGYYHESMGFFSMCMGLDRNLLLVGEINYQIQFDPAVVKVDINGKKIFSKRIELIKGGNFATLPYCIKATQDSGFIMAGFTDYPGIFNGNSLAFKTDSQCNVPKLVNIINQNKTVNGFDLFQNYPNPFNPNTIIKFNLPRSGHVSLDIFDVKGKRIQTLVNEFKPQGEYSILFDALQNNLSSGVYIYTVQFKGFSQTKKMLLVK